MYCCYTLHYDWVVFNITTSIIYGANCAESGYVRNRAPPTSIRGFLHKAAVNMLLLHEKCTYFDFFYLYQRMPSTADANTVWYEHANRDCDPARFLKKKVSEICTAPRCRQKLGPTTTQICKR